MTVRRGGPARGPRRARLRGGVQDPPERRGAPQRQGPLERRLDVDLVSTGTVRASGLARWLASTAPARARGSVTIAIFPDSRVRRLNRQYRRRDMPTDVLSFPSEEPGYLGDIVIAAGVARRQAREAGHSVPTELRILALHGLLHLLGYDHERDNGRMARVEARLRRRGGLREGLIERNR